MFRLLQHRWALLSAGVIAALLAVALRPQPVAVDVATIGRGTLTVTVNEDGRTRVRDRFVVAAPVGGRVLRLDLDPGDRVKRGDVVARVEPAMPPLIDARARAEAEAAVRSATAALGRAEAERRRADAAVAHADRELDRSRHLEAQGVVPAQEVEAREVEARVAHEAASAAVFATQAAAGELQQAQARLAAPAGRAAGVVAVRSPADGVILRRVHESESTVPAGAPLVEIGDPGRLEVVVDLLSADASRVRERARALIDTGRGDTPLDGRVRRIEPSGFTKVSALGVEEQRVNVILDIGTQLDEGGVTLGDGYRVDVAIVLREVANAVLAPTSALFRDGNEWAVYELRNGRAHHTLVSVGEQTARQAQVLTGLSEGARVVVHPGERVVDGVRLDARDEAR